MRKPGGLVSEAVTSAGSVVTIPAFVRDSRASTLYGLIRQARLPANSLRRRAMRRCAGLLMRAPGGPSNDPTWLQ